jgi:hypothetical protein
MDTVKVNRDELLKAVQSNREQHRNTFEKACVGYRKEVIARLDAMLTDAKAGKRIVQSVGLIEPMDQTKDYDRAIRMLQMSVDETIELSQTEFAQYVMDDWRWKDQFTNSTMNYVG